MTERIKICKYDNCNNIVKGKRQLVCYSCRHLRRKNKPWDGIIPNCDIHGKLQLDEMRLYDGKFKCKLCINLKNKSLRRPNYISEYVRKRNLKKFNLTVEDYEKMLLNQGYVCKICNLPETTLVNSKEKKGQRTRNLAVDHCAKTNIVRGLLCLKCNSMIGNSKDNPDILRNGALYLESVTVT